jgi:uncharacterized protein (TIGR02466 family)
MIHSLFPSYIYEAQIAKPDSTLNQNLLEECYKFQKQDLHGHKWSSKHYVGGYTSYASLNQMYKLSPYFEDLQKRLDKHVAAFVERLEMDIKPKELKMTSLWMNIMPKGVVHTMHIHPLSTISGSYYVQVPSNASALKIEDPRLVNFMASPPRKAKASPSNQRFISFQPKAGSTLMFESWMRHEVPPNTSKSDRISISFNYDWCS